MTNKVVDILILTQDEIDELVAALTSVPPIATETRNRWIDRLKA